jgi:phosphatidylserine/phosphatidylglycerophosphate/cardiolipin synthase-like enzyme
VTSANLTEAAQERNIEAGVLVEDEGLAHRLRLQFDGLIERGELRSLLV